MTQPGPVPYKVEFDRSAQAFLDSLTPRQYGRAMGTVFSLVDDPHSDGRTRIPLPFPYRFGSIGYTANGFFIIYAIEEPSTLVVLNITWDNPDYWG